MFLKAAADKFQGLPRQMFVEFLMRSCTAELSGFFPYKELGRRLKKTNRLVVAEIFTLMSRDKARHAGFLNKGLSDFHLAFGSWIFDQDMEAVYLLQASVYLLR